MSFTLGCDLSHWAGDINFGKMYDAGARWVVIKASDAYRDTGQQWEDVRFDRNAKQIFERGQLLAGCYHWLQASLDPIKAADFYLERYYRYDFQFPPVMDFEEKSVFAKGLANHYIWCAEVWLDYVHKQTGRLPIVYTANWYTKQHDQSKLAWMKKYPLWVASYPWVWTSLSKPLMPGNIWDDWTLWQYSADNNNRGKEFGQVGGSIDLNWFKGSYADLLDWLGIEVNMSEPLTKLYYPCDERWPISQRFGERPNVYTTSRGHNGVDWAIPVGNPIYAAWDGTVEVARADTAGYGRHVRIRHSHGLTIYGHMSRNDVKVGDKVSAKQVIGLSGGAKDDPYGGMTTGPHLHFEYRLEYPPTPLVPGSYVYNAIDVYPLLIPHVVEDVLFRAKCVTAALNVRSGPGTGYPRIGGLLRGDIVNVHEVRDNWFRIGVGRWVSGVPAYMERIEIVPPVPDPDPEPLTLEERVARLEKAVFG